MSGPARKKTAQRGLGKGVNILIPEMTEFSSDSAGDDGVKVLNINEIEPNREQPRRLFEDEALNELAESIRAFGIIQPLIVRKSDGYYEIVAGERRWRAARLAGLTEIPVVIRTYDEQNALQVSLIENIQRENLTVIEEALTYKRLQDEFEMTQDAIAETVGKKRSTVANSLRLLSLPKKIHELLEEGKISAGHAKALLASNSEEIQLSVAERIVNEDLNVRQAEEIMKQISAGKRERSALESHPYHLLHKGLEAELSSLFGTKVKLSAGKNKSKIEIEYFSDEDLDRLVGLFKKLED